MGSLTSLNEVLANDEFGAEMRINDDEVLRGSRGATYVLKFDVIEASSSTQQKVLSGDDVQGVCLADEQGDM